MNRSQTNFGLGTRFLLALYSSAAACTLLLTAPFRLRELRPGGKYREGLRERLGGIPARLQAPATGGSVLWLHAVSVGEVLAAAPLVEALRAALPDGRVFISTTTRTGQAIARSRFGAASVFYFPADFAFAVRAWLRFLRPSAIILVESELWPRMLVEAHRAGIPVAVVNGRISARSWPRYQRLAALWRPLLRSLAFAQAQSGEDAVRLQQLGAQNVSVGGNLKFDRQDRAATFPLRALQASLPAFVPVLVCGSTLAGEEEFLLKNLPPASILLLAPRHPERFDEIAATLTAQSRPWLRLSLWRSSQQPIAAGSILLLDSVGDLAAVYAVATVAIIGGGFLHAGGHNPLEAAVLGKPILIGPGYANFLDAVEKLQLRNAIVVADLHEVLDKTVHLLQYSEEARAMGERARQVCLAQTGATDRAAAAILEMVQR